MFPKNTFIKVSIRYVPIIACFAESAKVLHICIDFWLLAHLTHDFSQAEKKQLLQAEQLTKLPVFSFKMTNLTILSEIVIILWFCSACNNIYFLLSLR